MEKQSFKDLICILRNDTFISYNPSNKGKTDEVLLKLGFHLFVNAAVEWKHNIQKDINEIIEELRQKNVIHREGSIILVTNQNGETISFFKPYHSIENAPHQNEFGYQMTLSPKEDLIGYPSKESKKVLKDVFISGTFLGNNDQFTPVYAWQSQTLLYGGKRFIPLKVPGLDELLFPNRQKDKRGFTCPDENSIVPRVIVIKGAPGTGKTTLGIQMLIDGAKSRTNCVYLCSNDAPNSVKSIALGYGFVPNEKTFEEISKDYIEIRDIRENIDSSIVNPEIGFNPLSSQGKSKWEQLTQWSKYVFSKSLEEEKGIDLLIVDSLNLAQLYESKNDGNLSDREQLFELIGSYKKKNFITVFLLEDYGNEGTEQIRELIADCEFLADVVIQLGSAYRHDYHTRCINVKKKHFGQQIHGNHFYKICPIGHALSNLNPSSGIVVYPSIHKYLSSAREGGVSQSINLGSTGITHLDAILSGESKSKPLFGEAIPENSCVVVRGKKGGHKLPLAINILLGGMWKSQVNDTDSFSIEPANDVLMILLDEEANINLDMVGIAKDTHIFTEKNVLLPLKTLDNGNYLKWIKHPQNGLSSQHLKSGTLKNKCHDQAKFNEENNRGMKVFFHKWCAEIIKENGVSTGECRKLVVATFRPGCITPEEFVASIENLLTTKDGHTRFSRVLFSSTAHLQMRFPLLDKEDLFIPSMIDLFKSRNVLSIFVDVEGKGANDKLSYGLSSLADYLIRLDSFTTDLDIHKIKVIPPKNQEKNDLGNEYLESFLTDKRGFVFSRLLVENIRGKEYTRSPHALTVRPSKQNEDINLLHILDIEDTGHETPTIEIGDQNS